MAVPRHEQSLSLRQSFYVEVIVIAEAENRRGGDAFAGAWFHDPQKIVGATYSGTGIVPEIIVDAAAAVPPVFEQVPAAMCTTGTDPAAGTIQFENAATRISESGSGGAALIGVTRSGGSKGEMTALFTMAGGDAVAGVDYTSVSTLVRFPDGDGAMRFVPVPIIDNADISDVRDVGLQLSDVRGCAALGTRSAANLIILDDDAPPTTPTYALGGTVGGLEGTGLAPIETLSGARIAPAGNGAFAFAERFYTSAPYHVRVETQPAAPAQLCTVTNGDGNIGTADVANVSVSCGVAPGAGSLDPTFGVSGKVSSSSFSTGRAVALQADGKSVMLAAKTLSRFNVDGSLDTTFGIAGKVTIVAGGGALDAMEGLAIQGDGKIVVTGYTSTPPALIQDITVQRFNSDGTLDATFGSGGKVVTDFSGSEDLAYAVAIQGDGKILVAGTTIVGSGASTDRDFAVVRYDVDGSLDSSFGDSGKTHCDVAGTADYGYAIAWQFDGKIVIAGRVAADGGANPDFGFVRLEANGQRDLGFGTAGRAQVDFEVNNWDEARDVLLQPDGKIVAGGFARIGTVYQYAVTRLNSDGTPDAKFGSGGKVTTTLTAAENFGRALARQSDDKILIAGQVSSLANGDFGVLRLMNTGAVDTSFGTGGLLTIDFFGIVDDIRDMVIQADGKILVVGSGGNRTGLFGMARIEP